MASKNREIDWCAVYRAGYRKRGFDPDGRMIILLKKTRRGWLGRCASSKFRWDKLSFSSRDTFAKVRRFFESGKENGVPMRELVRVVQVAA